MGLLSDSLKDTSYECSRKVDKAGTGLPLLLLLFSVLTNFLPPLSLPSTSQNCREGLGARGRRRGKFEKFLIPFLTREGKTDWGGGGRGGSFKLVGSLLPSFFPTILKQHFSFGREKRVLPIDRRCCYLKD